MSLERFPMMVKLEKEEECGEDAEDIESALSMVHSALELNAEAEKRIVRIERALLKFRIELLEFPVALKPPISLAELSTGFYCQFLPCYFGGVRSKHSDHVYRTVDDLMFRVKNQMEAKITATGNAKIKELLSRNWDWDDLAVDVKICTGSEIQKIWCQVIRPSLLFSGADFQLELKATAEKFHFKNWDTIASVHPLCTPYYAFAQCRMYFNQTVLNKGNWTEDEDMRLLTAVRCCEYGRVINWNKAFYYIEGRSIPQILNRWYRLNPGHKRGKFTADEDALLQSSVAEIGPDFAKIASIFGDRTPIQLRERHYILSANNIKLGEWTLAEDQLLLELVQKYGEGKWCEIAKNFPTRNRTQIRHRFTQVIKKKCCDPTFSVEKLSRPRRTTHVNSLNKRESSESHYEKALTVIHEKLAVDRDED